MAPNFGLTSGAIARSHPTIFFAGGFQRLEINIAKKNHLVDIKQRFKLVKRKYEKVVAG
jgi:hypothetical protein